MQRHGAIRGECTGARRTHHNRQRIPTTPVSSLLPQRLHRRALGPPRAEQPPFHLAHGGVQSCLLRPRKRVEQRWCCCCCVMIPLLLVFVVTFLSPARAPHAGAPPRKRPHGRREPHLPKAQLHHRILRPLLPRIHRQCRQRRRRPRARRPVPVAHRARHQHEGQGHGQALPPLPQSGRQRRRVLAEEQRQRAQGQGALARMRGAGRGAEMGKRVPRALLRVVVQPRVPRGDRLLAVAAVAVVAAATGQHAPLEVHTQQSAVGPLLFFPLPHQPRPRQLRLLVRVQQLFRRPLQRRLRPQIPR